METKDKYEYKNEVYQKKVEVVGMSREEAKKEVARWMQRGTPLNVARADIQQVVINKIYDQHQEQLKQQEHEIVSKYQNVISESDKEIELLKKRIRDD